MSEKYKCKNDRSRKLIAQIISNPSNVNAYQELYENLKPFMIWVIKGKDNVIPYMSFDDYLLECEIAVWECLQLFMKEPDRYENIKDAEKEVAYLFTAIKNAIRRTFRSYVKNHMVVAKDYEAYGDSKITSTIYVTYDYLIEEWNRKHQEYNHAHDDERKAYYQANKERYHEYNRNYYKEHREELILKQRIRNACKKSERLGQSKP